jgi:23S rRNA (guanosine2251-2'-O)-methyltransferase
MKQKQNTDLIFGIHATIEAIRSGKEVNRVMVQRGLRSELLPKLNNELKQLGIEPVHVPVEKLNSLGNRNHQGVVAFISPIEYQKIEEVLPMVFEKGEVPLLLILDRITDVRNFGAIARSAECMGVHAIVIPSKGGALVTSDAVKTSAGALLKIPVCKHHNLKNTIDFIKDSGVQMIGCTEKTNHMIYEHDYTEPTCIIMGNEEEGISEEYLKRCHHRGKIPMSGTIESLNVSVSAGIILYEAIKQRGLA